MDCPKCNDTMITAKATDFGDEYLYCRTCKQEFAEIEAAIKPKLELVVKHSDFVVADSSSVRGGHRWDTTVPGLVAHCLYCACSNTSVASILDCSGFPQTSEPPAFIPHPTHDTDPTTGCCADCFVHQSHVRIKLPCTRAFPGSVYLPTITHVFNVNNTQCVNCGQDATDPRTSANCNNANSSGGSQPTAKKKRHLNFRSVIGAAGWGVQCVDCNRVALIVTDLDKLDCI